MTPAKMAKELGLNGLAQVKELTKKSDQTLTNWCNDQPDLFEIVLLGCVAKAEEIAFKDAPIEELNANSALFGGYGR